MCREKVKTFSRSYEKELKIHQKAQHIKKEKKKKSSHELVKNASTYKHSQQKYGRKSLISFACF